MIVWIVLALVLYVIPSLLCLWFVLKEEDTYYSFSDFVGSIVGCFFPIINICGLILMAIDYIEAKWAEKYSKESTRDDWEFDPDTDIFGNKVDGAK